ncbi:DUF2201 family putative metallopeptidase [Candidatus Caldatribacterium sp.]|uniref:vWA domain-containing protein n=1 Tax=Candidatus Caldatribacterium sp. TaxID=2282143 RepID=UPI00383CC865|nr:VWA-like domain-containing protein [Candidatus Caldatribacterium sp.]
MKKVEEVIFEEITKMIASAGGTSFPLLGSALLRFQVKVVGKEFMAPAGVDIAQRCLYIREDITEMQDSVRTILAHEALHILGGTFLRKGDRDHVLWNFATDLEINWLLADMGLRVRQGLYDEKFHGKYAEEIYEVLEKRAREKSREVAEALHGLNELVREYQQAQQQGDKERMQELKEQMKNVQRSVLEELGLRNNTAEVNHHEDITDELARRFVMETMVAAQQLGKMGIGKLPGELDRVIDELLEAKIDWKELLENAILDATRNDYSYRKPYKPSLVYADTYIPSLNEPDRREVVIIVDTSGSISEGVLRLFLSEVKEILASYKVIFIACDASVQAVVEDGDIEEIVKKVKGGGGTSFAPAFQYIAERLHDRYHLPVVLMTDGYNDDDHIDRPLNVSEIIVLTTGKEPKGLEVDRVITLPCEE